MLLKVIGIDGLYAAMAADRSRTAYKIGSGRMMGFYTCTYRYGLNPIPYATSDEIMYAIRKGWLTWKDGYRYELVLGF